MLAAFRVQLSVPTMCWTLREAPKVKPCTVSRLAENLHSTYLTKNAVSDPAAVKCTQIPPFGTYTGCTLSSGAESGLSHCLPSFESLAPTRAYYLFSSSWSKTLPAFSTVYFKMLHPEFILGERKTFQAGGGGGKRNRASVSGDAAECHLILDPHSTPAQRYCCPHTASVTGNGVPSVTQVWTGSVGSEPRPEGLRQP